MKNITVTVDDDTYRAARIRAAELGTSVSVLVKDYLQGLLRDDPAPLETKGWREMPLPFNAMPLTEALPPGAYGFCPDGKPYYTKDGKPRKPGAMRHLGVGWTEDFDSWPDGFMDAMLGDETEAANNWWKPHAKPPVQSKK